jgi:hypothetical protein
MKARSNINFMDTNYTDVDSYEDTNEFKIVSKKRTIKNEQVISPISKNTDLSPISRHNDLSPISKYNDLSPTSKYNDLSPTYINSISDSSPTYINNISNESPIKKSRRNLDAFKEDIAEDIAENNRKKLNKEQYTNNKQQYTNQQQANNYRSVQEKVNNTVTNVDVSNSTLFPTLGQTQANDTKKISVWNIFNPSLMSKNDNFQNDTSNTQGASLNNKPQNNNSNVEKQVINKTNKQLIQVSNKDINFMDDDEVSIESYEDYEYEDEYEDEEDSEITYMREKWEKREQLLDDIDFVKMNYKKSNKMHVMFLHQLESELADIEDEIDRYEFLENELVQIYGPSYNDPYYVTDEIANKRKAEEEKINEKTKMQDFLKMLNSTKV